MAMGCEIWVKDKRSNTKLPKSTAKARELGSRGDRFVLHFHMIYADKGWDGSGQASKEQHGNVRLPSATRRGMVRARRATRVNSGRARSSDSTTVKTGVTTEIEKKGHEQSWAARR